MKRARANLSAARSMALAALLTIAPAFAQAPAPKKAPAEIEFPDRPQAARRLVERWDFEDKISRVEPVPPGWFRAQDAPGVRDRPAYPAYNVPEIERTIAFAGQRSVMLPTSGGSTSLMLAAGSVAALPLGDYAVTAMVRTDGLRHARARVSARFLDTALLPIPGAEAATIPVETAGAWTPVDLLLPGRAEAAWVQIELELLQPDRWSGPPGPQQTRVEDFSGKAYFDDVALFQVPRLTIETQWPGNLFVAPESPEVWLQVRDLTGEALRMRLALLDLEGNTIDSFEGDAPESARRWNWRPLVPRYGWYRITAEVAGKSGTVGRTALDLVWASSDAAPDAPLRQSFGVIAEDLSESERVMLPQLAARAYVGAVHLAAFAPGVADEDAIKNAESSGRIAEALLAQGMDVTFVLTNLPQTLAREARADTGDALAVFTTENDPWTLYLSRMLTSFGERVRRWQFGPTPKDSSQWERSRRASAEQISQVREKLKQLIPRPIIAFPSNLFYPDSWAGEADSVTVLWPAGVSAGDVADTLRLGAPGFTKSPPATAAPGKSTPPARERTLVIEPLDEQVFGRRASAEDLARRAVLAWAAGERRLALPAPWRRGQGIDAPLQPEVEVAVWRTLSRMLSGSSIVGELPMPDGARALIARTPRGGMLIAWNERAADERVDLEGYLGSGAVRAIDIFGNQDGSTGDTATHATTAQGGPVLTESPIFIEGVDLSLLQFRAAIRLEPPYLPARAERHLVELVVENPWNEGISGRVRIADPVQWNIAPRVMAFSLAPGKSVRLPIEVSFNVAEEAGHRLVTAEVELIADRRYPIQRLPLALEIGLPAVELLASYRRERGPTGEDLIISALITNVSQAPVTLEAFAQAPGYRVFSAPVSELQPGASVTRRFRFDAGGERLRGRSVRVGVKESDGTGRLNRTLVIE